MNTTFRWPELSILRVVVLCCLLGTVSTVSWGQAGPPDFFELIVLLEPEERGGLRPEEVVSRVNENRVPPELAEGNPTHARLALSRRATGRSLDWIRDHPDSATGRLERYVVLRYRDRGQSRAGIMTALSQAALVQHVEENLPVTLTAPVFPSDPLLGTDTSPPASSQWGIHVLNLPEAWGSTVGHGYAGMVDVGLMVLHPDLRASHVDSATGRVVLDGGNFREQLSRDLVYPNTCSVDELDPDDGVVRTSAGHGSHVAGILAATTDNGPDDPLTPEPEGAVAGVCWHCSLMVAKAFPASDTQTFINQAAAGVRRLAELGSQTINMSFIVQAWNGCAQTSPDLSLFCTVLEVAAKRDVFMAASSGNRRDFPVNFPANDPRVVAVGGVEADGAGGFEKWDDAPAECPFPGDTINECGSSKGPTQELAAPAKTVVATLYVGKNHNATLKCGDVLQEGDLSDGIGPCTGSSMSAGFVSGCGTLVRSVDPTLTTPELRSILTSTASHAASWTEEIGYGVPDAAAAVDKALGVAAGKTLVNRLTPLFRMYSPGAATHLDTTAPQMAARFLLDDPEPFSTVGNPVPGYPFFPDESLCSGPGCHSCAATACIPRASVYVLTTYVSPLASSPLVPIFRLSRESGRVESCDRTSAEVAASTRDFALAVPSELDFFVNDIAGPGAYAIDGLEGYIYAPCSPDCIPRGAVRLYRLYHPGRADFAVFPESELASMQAQGYVSFPGLADVIGYAYPNVDTDGDGLVDGFEFLFGTDEKRQDSDCDGFSDGTEVLDFGAVVPGAYSDPRTTDCGFFEDGFESGDTSAWSSTVG